MLELSLAVQLNQGNVRASNTEIKSRISSFQPDKAGEHRQSNHASGVFLLGSQASHSRCGNFTATQIVYNWCEVKQ